MVFGQAQCIAQANGNNHCSSSTVQNLTGTLHSAKEVVTNGGNINAVIDETTGLLSTALVPGFILRTNTNTNIPVELKAEANTTGGLTTAMAGTGATGSTFIALTNSTALPTLGAVGDALSGAPTPAVNANVIAYPVDKPADIAGELVYLWNGADRWNGTLSHKGETLTALNIPATTPKASTFSLDDVDGSYQATITLSFISAT